MIKIENVTLEQESEPGLLDCVLKTYGEEDLAEFANFQGGYINFGYWKNIPLPDQDIISVNDRIKSSEALYDFIFEIINPKDNQKLLEVGCGRGLGCERLFAKNDTLKISGVDVSPAQILRCSERKSAISFHCMQAEYLDFLKRSFDVIYSVEAAQHFVSMNAFFEKSKPILKPGGKLIITAHLATSQKALNEMHANDWVVKEGIDNLTPITSVIEMLYENDYKDLSVKSIGKHVFPGYDKWVHQVSCGKPWAKNLFKSYETNLLDYFLIQASA